MHILILGHAGFVGKAFTRRLLEDGHTVTGVDIRISKSDWMRLYQADDFRKPAQFNYVVDDCRRFFTIRKVHEFDLVIHCAAIVGGRVNIDGNPLSVATNLSIDSEFFDWVVRTQGNKPKVIYFSSSAIYPVELQQRNKHVALAESLVDLNSNRFSMPDQTYGFAKFAGEFLAQKAIEDYDAHVVIYRPFGGYGEGQDLNYPFPSIIKRIVDCEDPVVVWGSGDQLRDFIHIDDIVDAVLATYSKLPAGQPLNLGTGRATSFKDLAWMACRLVGYKAKIVNDSAKPEGVFARVADPYELFKWYEPKIPLEKGVYRMLMHHLDGSKVLV